MNSAAEQSVILETPEWLVETVALLEARPRHMSLADISKDTGISAAWLSQFSRGVSHNPGIMQVWRLRQYLRQHVQAS
jgi:hypothetical protein